MPPLKVFISYSHDTPDHSRRVLDLSNRLRTSGIDCNIDQYQVSPPDGWPLWMDRQVTDADFVLVICTETYLGRFQGRERQGMGLGVRWESLILSQHLYEAGAINTKFVPVVFQACDAEHIPTPLKAATRIYLEPVSGYDDLLRRLYNIPPAEKPELGQPLPPRHLDPAFFRTPANNFLAAGITRNLDFVGREFLLRDLHDRLHSGNVALQHVLTGEGGVGKTQLAIEYAHRHAGDYDGLWWLDASSHAVEAATETLAVALGLAIPLGTPPDQIRLALRQRLSGSANLLILDNLEDPDLLRELLLQSPARLLVTTRRTDLPTGIASPLEVDVLTDSEAVDLLRKHRPDLEDARHTSPLAAVANYLGRHSLAVALAGAYLGRRKNVTPADLLTRLQRAEIGDKDDLFQGLDPAKDIGAGYKLKVAQSLSLHFDQIAGKLAEKVLHIAAFCHPDAIPLDLLRQAAGNDNLAQEQIEDAVLELATLSIVKYSTTVSIHRLMQSVVRSRLEPPARRATIAALINALVPVFENSLDPMNMLRQDPYAAHAQTGLDHPTDLECVENTGNLASQLGLYLMNRVRYDAALAALKLAEQIDRAAYGDDHTDVARDVNNIGSVLQDKGDLDAALKCFREAERIDRVAHGSSHPNVATCVNNIGGVLLTKGDLDQALTYFREAEQIDRATHGDNHPNIARDVNNIGSALQDKGDLDGAFRCYREAEQINRVAYGNDHPTVATNVNNIGRVLRAKGDLDGAMKCFCEAKRIDQATYGNDGPRIARDVNNIASIFRAKGDLGKALKCFREAERISRAAYGDDHSTTATYVNNVGSVLLQQGDRAGAAKAATEAFRIVLITLGPQALNTIQSARNLAALHLDPLALARQFAGDQVAADLALAMQPPPAPPSP